MRQLRTSAEALHLGLSRHEPDLHLLVDRGPAEPGPSPPVSLIRVRLPAHLRILAGVRGSEVVVEIRKPATQRSVLDALEAKYPALQGTVREHASGRRRAYVRFFACDRDLSLEEPEAPLPGEVVRGEEPFLVVGAIAGG